MKTLGVILFVFGVLLLAFCTVSLWFNKYQIDRDINGWKTRAQVSSEPNDMHEYMSNVKTGMARWDMTSGYAALILQKPDNDMKLILRTVEQHVDQAKVLTTLSRSSPEYQTGLDNLRGSIRELDLHAGYYWEVHQGLLFLVGVPFGFVILLVGAAIVVSHPY